MKPRERRISRRTALAALCAGLMGPSAAAWAGPGRRRRRGRPKPEGGRKLLLIGDSMIGGGLGLYLENALAREHGYAVLREGRPSTGLARPDFFDWPERARELAASFSPELSVVMFGGNDVQGLRMPDGSWIRWGEPHWRQEYARRVVSLYETLAPTGQPVFWIGMPVVEPPRMRERVRVVNTIYRAEMAIRRDAHFVDTWPVLATTTGDFARRLVVSRDGAEPREAVIRGKDGVHLTVSGAKYLASVLRSRIVEVAGPGSAQAAR